MRKTCLSVIVSSAVATALLFVLPNAADAQTITYYGNGAGGSASAYSGPGYRVITYYYANPLFYNTSPNIPVQTFSNPIYSRAGSGVRANDRYTYVQVPWVNYVPTNDPKNPYYYTISPYYNYAPSSTTAYPYSYADYPYVNYTPLPRRPR